MYEKLISKHAEAVSFSAIRKIFNRAQELEDVINFGIGEPDFTTPDVIVKSAKRAMDEGYTHYTVNAGYPEIRRLISQKLKKDNLIVADPAQEIILTCGGMGGLYLALRTLIDPGDEVLVPDPCWLNYAAQISLAGGVKVSVPVGKDRDFSLSADLLKEYVTDKTKLLILNTPCNPTGKVIPGEELNRIARLSEEKNFLIISDEVYEKFVWDGQRHISIGSFPEAAGRTITVNSMSKTYAMTGWRIGYTCGPAEIIKNMVKLQENIYACPSSISQIAAGTALSEGEDSLSLMVREYAGRRDLFFQELEAIDLLQFIRTEGSFYIFVDISQTGLSSEDFSIRLLEERGVAVVPGSAFGRSGEGFVRMSFATDRRSIKNGILRIGQFVLNR
jgi:aminotransferase